MKVVLRILVDFDFSKDSSAFVTHKFGCLRESLVTCPSLDDKAVRETPKIEALAAKQINLTPEIRIITSPKRLG